MMKHIEEADEKLHSEMYLCKKTPWHKLFSRDIQVQLDSEIKFYKEELEYIKRDIYKDIVSDNVIIEGCALMPSLINSLTEEQNIIYMVATEKFQLEKYKLRTWAYEILKEADDPKLAFDKWMHRDIRFGKYIINEAHKYNYPVIGVDGTKTVEELGVFIINFFKLKDQK